MTFQLDELEDGEIEDMIAIIHKSGFSKSFIGRFLSEDEIIENEKLWTEETPIRRKFE